MWVDSVKSGWVERSCVTEVSPFLALQIVCHLTLGLLSRLGSSQPPCRPKRLKSRASSWTNLWVSRCPFMYMIRLFFFCSDLLLVLLRHTSQSCEDHEKVFYICLGSLLDPDMSWLSSPAFDLSFNIINKVVDEDALLGHETLCGWGSFWAYVLWSALTLVCGRIGYTL